MARLHVCPLSRLPATAAQSGARSLITLMTAGHALVRRPDAIAPDRHLLVGVSDIVSPTAGYTHPEEGHVAAMLAFFAAWDREAPLLMHCYAGVSRSTAAAYVGACALRPDRSEEEVAAALRSASPTATPNARIVALADALLGRQGRMAAAIARLGRGQDCYEGEPFWLEV